MKRDIIRQIRIPKITLAHEKFNIKAEQKNLNEGFSFLGQVTLVFLVHASFLSSSGAAAVVPSRPEHLDVSLRTRAQDQSL